MSSYSYCVVSNIPETFHSSDLRSFFSVFVEGDKFDLFHFRRRPQYIQPDPTHQEQGDEENSNKSSKKRLCALVRFRDNEDANQFLKKYNRKVWVDGKGKELFGMRVKVDKVHMREEDLEKFKGKELTAPSLMPKGNVGTPNQHFLNLIKECKLPPSLIKKLGLRFPKGRVNKKYSSVPFNYGTGTRPIWRPSRVQEENEEEEDGGTEIIDGKEEENNAEKETKTDSDTESHPDDDDDRCEEWERHEALNDHRTSHGTMFDEDKERLYEEKIELKWEKGGSGLVFYTDAQVWEEGQEDVDDWDVDMEGYYEPGAGDKDARDYLEMRKSERFRQGLEDISVFTKKHWKEGMVRRSPSPEPSCSSSSSTGTIGAFEKYTKGIGRKVMENSGWKDGQGLGSTIKGIPNAIEGEGQPPADKRGFGYYGEKLEYTSKKDRAKRKHFNEYQLDSEKIKIATIYDKPEDLDIQEPLLRRNAVTHIKRYPDFVKEKK